MPIHDWTRAEMGIFHQFHESWIEEIRRALNGGLLPAGYYAQVEQVARPTWLDALPLLRRPIDQEARSRRTQAVAVRQVRERRLVALVEVVAPGDKSGIPAQHAFAARARETLAAGTHLLLVDLLPPTAYDPRGLHSLIAAGGDKEVSFDVDRPLVCAAYVAGEHGEGLIETLAVGDSLPAMPLYLAEDADIPLPLEDTYQAAFNALPDWWRGILARAPD